MGTLHWHSFSTVFKERRDNLCDVLFVSQGEEALSEWGLLLRARIFLKANSFFPGEHILSFRSRAGPRSAFGRAPDS